MRWLLWLGGGLTVGGLWWLFQGVDVLAGTSDRWALAGGASLFLVGMVLMGWGIGAAGGEEG